ncbi:hypothetical protein AKO1_003840, partial [Acrasis kona]
VKTITFEETFNAPIKTLCDAIFFNKNFQNDFHTSTEDIKVNVGDWIPSQDKSIHRTVIFDTPVNAPSMIISMLRLGPTITCRLEDDLTWSSGEDSFTVKSGLFFMDIPGVNQDVVKVDINYNANKVSRSRTHVILSISCEFITRIWGLTGIVEKYMEKDAHKSFEKWIQLAERHLREYQQKIDQDDDDDEDQVTSIGSSPISVTSSTDYQSVLDHNNEEQDVQEEDDKKSVSSLLQRSYTLASLRRDLRQVRALVSKTEVRVKDLEQEYSNHQLDLTVNKYLQRVNQLYVQESNHSQQVQDRLTLSQQYVDIILAKYRRSSAIWWFMGGSFITFLFSFILPLTVWYIKRK